jgi:hypothetical protein
MPFNEQPELEGGSITPSGLGASNSLSEVMFFAFSLDEPNATISSKDGVGATTSTGDSTIVSTSGTGQSNVTTEGLGSSFFGDTNEGAL